MTMITPFLLAQLRALAGRALPVSVVGPVNALNNNDHLLLETGYYQDQLAV